MARCVFGVVAALPKPHWVDCARRGERLYTALARGEKKDRHMTELSGRTQLSAAEPSVFFLMRMRRSAINSALPSNAKPALEPGKRRR